MTDLYACPFCREIFAEGEASVCPSCDIGLARLADLPPSHDAALLEDEGPRVEPEHEQLPIHYLGRARGPLVLLAACGLGAFFGPWVHQTAPIAHDWTGFEFAKRLVWIWAAGISWGVMLPLVLSRRTIHQMRGARVAVAFLSAMVMATSGLRLAMTPKPVHPLVPVQVSWGWGLYMSGALAALALIFAVRFGGSIRDMPSQQQVRSDETMH